RARGVPEQARGARGRDRPSRGRLMAVLLIDNYDSFTYNLAHLFGELGADVVVRRNDAITADEAEELAPSHLAVSPGPGPPVDAGLPRSLGDGGRRRGHGGAPPRAAHRRRPVPP